MLFKIGSLSDTTMYGNPKRAKISLKYFNRYIWCEYDHAIVQIFLDSLLPESLLFLCFHRSIRKDWSEVLPNDSTNEACKRF